MNEDRLVIGYDRGNGKDVASLCVCRQDGDVTTIINQLNGQEANTIYALLVGIFKLNKDIEYYFNLSDKEVIENEKTNN